MLKELAQFIAFEIKELQSAQAARRFRACLKPLTGARSGPE
jgi:hypothetical protein